LDDDAMMTAAMYIYSCLYARSDLFACLLGCLLALLLLRHFFE
jgi:hypothetical protein